MRRRLTEVGKIDFFGAPGREATEGWSASSNRVFDQQAKNDARQLAVTRRAT
jgi:hypothetical protein